jgi:hypothetical protein
LKGKGVENFLEKIVSEAEEMPFFVSPFFISVAKPKRKTP